ncbi:hypothetical protein TNCV_3640691 [Trichonephila clavipes]|nr:hypothetical protein TNCV_3640691 [Trichonephila clavipes]
MIYCHTHNLLQVPIAELAERWTELPQVSVGRGQKCRPRSQARCSNTFVTAMEEPIDLRGAPGEDPLKWLKEYNRVANFNKWDDMMCLANVYFFFLTELRDSGMSTTKTP